MFGVALEIKVDDFKRLAQQPKVAVVGIIAQFVLLPAATFLLVWLISPHPSIGLGMMLVAACPGGNISNFLAHLAKGNTALSVSLTAVGTVLAIVLTPFNFQLWASLYAPTAGLLRTVELNGVELFQAILLVAGLPLALGMITAHYRPILAARLAKGVKPFSIVIFIGFVVIALAGNFRYFLQYIHLVAGVVFIHNALALATGYYAARITRLSAADCRTIAIETGIQNSGLGLLLIFTFFDGLGGMAFVAAWWGIWHIIAGLAVAGWWSRMSSDSKLTDS